MDSMKQTGRRDENAGNGLRIQHADVAREASQPLANFNRSVNGSLHKSHLVPDRSEAVIPRTGLDLRQTQREVQRDSGTPLPEGSIILGGRYRILELLHRRPRVNVYLARRQPRPGEEHGQGEATENLVAIRELVLVGLPLQVRTQIEQAAFEEFVSPVVLGSSRLPGAGDRVRVEGERHYLVMQLRGVRGERQAIAVPLAELLLGTQQWPAWLDTKVALTWGIQLGRIVARLHRLGLVFGDFDPSSVLVDRECAAEWAPVMLVFWPPAPLFWPGAREASTLLCNRVFPVARPSTLNAFAAPETLNGFCTERSDVYSLGAILYLLLTRYAPAAALRRQHVPVATHAPGHERSDLAQVIESMPLIPPHLFNDHISPALEHVVLRALSLNPAERYASAFAFVEALEAIDLSQSYRIATDSEEHDMSLMAKVTKLFHRQS